MRNEHQSLLEALKEQGPRAMHLMELVARLGLPKSEKKQVHKSLTQMCDKGLITQMPGNRYRLRRDRPTQNRSEQDRSQILLGDP